MHKVPYHGFLYRAASRDRPKPVIAKMARHAGVLFPGSVFIVTDMSMAARKVLRFYDQRGLREQRIREGKGALAWTRDSPAPASSQTRRGWSSLSRPANRAIPQGVPSFLK